jgi:hypothetical protein
VKRSQLMVLSLCFTLALTNALLLRVTAHPAATADSEVNGMGELIEAPADATVYVSLGELGQAVLSGGTKVRFAATNSHGGRNVGRALVAHILSGEVLVRLQPQAAGYVQVGDATFTTARGASFYASLRDGRTVFDASERTLTPLLAALGEWHVNAPESVLDATQRKAEGSAKKSRPLEPLRLNLTAVAKPIGRFESVGIMANDDRVAPHASLIWGNEVLKVAAGTNAQASLDGLGQVNLLGGTQARLLSTTINNDPQHRALAAVLLSGELAVKLQPTVSAYVQVLKTTFAASRGARFRVAIREGRAVFDATEGTGLELGDWVAQPLNELAAQVGQQGLQHRYLVRPVGLTSNIFVKASSTRQIQVQVTDENDKRVPDLPVVFSLNGTSGKEVGTLASTKVLTNAQGIATVEFNATSEASDGTITATIENTNFSWTGQVTAIKVAPGFWTRQNAIPVLATAAAALAAGVATITTKKDELPIQAVGKPVITP